MLLQNAKLLMNSFIRYMLQFFLRPRNDVLATKKFQKVLVIDLDETLVHATLKAAPNCDMRIEVVLNGCSYIFHVLKRPYAELFLQTVSRWYEIVIFTASLQQYADAVIDRLDPYNEVVQRRHFRESCIADGAGFVKDLRKIRCDVRNTIIIDNSPVAYSVNPENAVPIVGFIDDPHDRALLDLLPFLEVMRYVKDVRNVLGLRLLSTSTAV
mmetsp:Transcript_7412/g.11782  ORF Transcript_7412/g.11782 Transcript_7412/m.11782 type:complete len:212 (+) Transcript_7412:85-720(+)